MRFINLSHAIAEDMPLYPGTPAFKKERTRAIGKDTCNTFFVSFSNHAGTHIDGPWHFFSSGSKIKDFSAEDFIFKRPHIMELRKGVDEAITPHDFKRFHHDRNSCDCVILKTGFQKYRKKNRRLYTEKNPYLLPETAHFIKEKLPNVRAVAVDTISIGSCLHKDAGRDAHRILLKEDGRRDKGVFIIEDLNISEGIKRMEQLLVFPLIADKVDSSPCVAIGVIND